MAYPHGHHHHDHHSRDRREIEDYPPRPPPPFYEEFAPPPPPRPPPPFYEEFAPPPPPPQFYHTSHPDPYPPPGPYPPPPAPAFSHYPPPPQSAGDHHHRHHHHLPHFPSIVHHHSHHKDEEEAVRSSVRMYCKADSNYSLSIRNGKVILARHDPSDPFQHWIKDERHSTRVKDEQGFPSFALINKATGQAMKHSIGATYPVQLIPYNPDVLDESILWTESKDLGDSYRTIRMVNNIRLNVDAFHGDKNHGGVHDGSTIVLWEWKKGDNQRWKIFPH
ncbi:ricin B-like lectin R40G3 [Primulina tabacum]|uniref:ricin B-like lectin R40G3 n=1 Tax=Primulina tabacum TaxID=48773 RepID=UPI003F595DD7